MAQGRFLLTQPTIIPEHTASRRNTRTLSLFEPRCPSPVRGSERLMRQSNHLFRSTKRIRGEASSPIRRAPMEDTTELPSFVSVARRFASVLLAYDSSSLPIGTMIFNWTIPGTGKWIFRIWIRYATRYTVTSDFYERIRFSKAIDVVIFSTRVP